MSHVDVKIKRLHNSDVMSCITTSLKIAQAIKNTVYLEMDGYSLPISQNSYEVDIYKLYELEEKVKKYENYVKINNTQ